MTRVHTPDIAVLAVVLVVVTMAIAPVAVTASPGDSTSGTTIGDQLGDAGGSSDDSTDGGDSSEDSSTSDSEDAGDDGGDTDDGIDGTDDSTADSGGSGDSFDDADGTLETATSDVSNVTDEVALPDDVTGNVTTGATDADTERTPLGGAETTDDAATGATLEAVTFETTDEVTDTVDASTDAFLDETAFVLNAPETAEITSATTRTRFESARIDRVPAAAQSFTAPRSNGLSIGGAAATGSTPMPPAPATGLALGAGALAAAAVTRSGAVAPNLLATLGSSLGTALTAGLAPIAGRAGMLDRLVRMLAPFRYSRYDDSDPLEHDARSDVYDVVNDTPGAYLSEVADEADLPLSTARHHIRVLEREEIVSGAKVRGKRRFYPAYTQGIELAAALSDEATAAVIGAVARFGTASVSDIANELGRDPSTVSHHLKRLAEDDIVVRERDGRAVMNRLSAEARTALDPGHDSAATEAGEAMASD